MIYGSSLVFNFLDKDENYLFVRFNNNKSELFRLDLMLDGASITSITTTKDHYLFSISVTGMYHVELHDTSNKAKSISCISNILKVISLKKNLSKKTSKKTKTINKKINSIDKYTLEIKAKIGNEKLISNMFNLKLKKINLELSNIFSSDSLNTYEYFSYHDKSNFESLNEIAKLIENLDCVDYCCVAPDMSNYIPPKEIILYSETTHPYDAVTPNFLQLQTYLNEPNGMNVKNAWSKNINGSRATVRHLDFGIYRDHENFVGSNINVVNSRPENQDCNHGTASTGVIVAEKKEFGIAGIAYKCKFYFYDTGDIDKITNDAQPGDIVSLDIQFSINDKLLPAINVKSWWERIKIMVDKGATVILSAGNGGNDLSIPRIMNDYGDNGSMLVGACYHNSGKRVYFSNYGHETSLINSWGDWSVTTTGYGELQNAGKNRNYTSNYSGTSSATPLCAGALALIQDYAMSKNTILSPSIFKDIIKSSNYTEGVKDRIGYRPNVNFLLNKVDDLISSEYDFFEIPFNNSDIINDSYLLNYQKKHNKLVINNTNTCWTPEVYLPDFIKNNQIIKVTSVADKSTDIFYGGKKIILKKNSSAIFYLKSDIDITENSFPESGDKLVRWSPNSVRYEVDDLVEHNGGKYICTQAHVSNTGWAPGVANTLWKLVGQAF